MILLPKQVPLSARAQGKRDAAAAAMPAMAPPAVSSISSRGIIGLIGAMRGQSHAKNPIPDTDPTEGG